MDTQQIASDSIIDLFIISLTNIQNRILIIRLTNLSKIIFKIDQQLANFTKKIYSLILKRQIYYFLLADTAPV